jgi:hypothetical protein
MLPLTVVPFAERTEAEQKRATHTRHVSTPPPQAPAPARLPRVHAASAVRVWCACVSKRFLFEKEARRKSASERTVRALREGDGARDARGAGEHAHSLRHGG